MLYNTDLLSFWHPSTWQVNAFVPAGFWWSRVEVTSRWRFTNGIQSPFGVSRWCLDPLLCRNIAVLPNQLMYPLVIHWVPIIQPIAIPGNHGVNDEKSSQVSWISWIFSCNQLLRLFLVGDVCQLSGWLVRSGGVSPCPGCEKHGHCSRLWRSLQIMEFEQQNNSSF